MEELICYNSHTEADSIKVVTPPFTAHSFSSGSIHAASFARPGNKQNMIHTWRTLLPVLVVWMFKNSSQCQGVMYVICGFYFWWTLCTEFSQPPVEWYRELFPRNKAAEASNHSPSSSAEINNGWSFTSALPHDFVTCTVNKLFFFLILRDSKRIQNSAWSLDYASGHSSMQWTAITWSSDRELLMGPTTRGPVSPISTWRRK